MSAPPAFTVLIPTYRRPDLLREAIASVLAQTFDDFEVLVVDDASGDETPEVVDAVQDPRVRYVCRDRNGGAGATRNTGFEHARGDLVALLDDDDVYLPEFLARTHDVLRTTSPEVGFSWCGIRWLRRVAGEGYVLEREERWEPRYPSREAAYLAFLQNRRVGTNCGLTVKRRAFERIGGFDESLHGGAEDTDFLIRLVREFDFRVVPANLVEGRLHEGPSLRGVRAEKVDDYEAIMAKHARALSAHPSLAARLHYKAGWMSFHAGDANRGRAHFREAARRRPGMVKLWASWLLMELPGGAGPRLHRWVSERRRGRRALSSATSRGGA